MQIRPAPSVPIQAERRFCSEFALWEKTLDSPVKALCITVSNVHTFDCSWEKISLLKIICWCWLSIIFYFLVCLQTIPYPNYSWMLIQTDHAVNIHIIIFENFWCIDYQGHAILTWSSQTNSIMFYFYSISDRQWASIDVCWLNHNADHGITIFAKTFSIICHLKKSWGRLLHNITYM